MIASGTDDGIRGRLNGIEQIGQLLMVDTSLENFHIVFAAFLFTFRSTEQVKGFQLRRI